MKDIFDLQAVLSLNADKYYSGLADAENRAGGFGSKIGGALGTAAKVGAAALTATTGAAVAFGKSAVDAGAEFDAGMSRVGAIAGEITSEDLQGMKDIANEIGLTFSETGDTTATAMDILRNKAIAMGQSTKFTAQESAEALNYMAMAGWKGTQMMSGLDGIMNLAAASGEDLGKTSDIVTDALTAFGLKAEDATHFADVLAAASSNSNTNVGMLGESFKYVAPMAGSLGYSIEDVSVALGLMANSGIKSTMAGTSLRNILSAMAKPTDTQAMAMQKLGVSLDDGQGHMLSLMDVMRQFREGFGNLQISGDELTASLADLDSQLEAGTLSEKDYDKAVEDLTQRAFGAEGAIKAQTAAQLAGARGLSGLLAIVNTSDEDFERLTASINNAGGASEDMSDKMMDNLAGAQTLLKSAIGTAQIVVSDQLTPTITDFVNLATQGVTEVTKAFQSGGLEGAMDAFGTWLSDALNKVIEKLPDVVNAGASLLGALIEGLTQNIGQITEAAVKIVESLVQLIFDNLPTLGTAALTMIQTLAENLRSNLPELVPVAVDAILTMAEGLIDSLPEIADAALQIIVGLGEGLIASIPTLLEHIPVIIGELVGAIIELQPKLAEAGFELFVALITNAPDIIKALWDFSTELIVNIVKAVIEAVPKVAQEGLNLFMSLFSRIKEAYQPLAKAVGDLLIEIWNTITGFVGDMITLGQNLIQGLIDGITNKAGALWDKITSIGGKVVSVLTGQWEIASPSKVFKRMGGFLMEGLSQGIEGGLPMIEGAMDDVDDAISDAFGDDEWEYETPITTTMTSSEEPARSGKQTRTDMLLAEILEALYHLGINIDGRAMVGQIAPYMDERLGLMNYYDEREVYA